MLSKPVGPTGLFTLTSTPGTYTASRTDGQHTLKVRIAVSTPAVINFAGVAADNNSDILMPAGHVEHFTLASTNVIKFVKLSGATDGYISITTVA